MLDKYNLKENESKWQKFWKENNTYKFNKESGKEIYSIDTPPPTINGKPHMGHLFSYLHIDIMARHQKKLGKEILFPFGYDDNGISSNQYAEKKLKISAKKIDRDEFIKLCDNATQELEKEFKSFYESIGYSADLDNTFRSCDSETARISQESFLEFYENGMIERKEGSTLWCTTCQTSCSQSELEQEELESTFNYLHFQIEGMKDKIVIATTRPELLCGCIAIFINPQDKKNKKYIGKNAIIPHYNFTAPIIANPDADLNKGSGIVMCCTFGDEADAKWQKEYNLPIKTCIAHDGKMTEISKELAGFSITEARTKIIEILKANGSLFRQDAIKHNVATHDRCHKPIEIIAKPQWYIKILDKKDELLKKAEEINWCPYFTKNRITNWIKGLKWDWCISRQVFFGINIPAWYCKSCNNIILPQKEDLPINPIKDKPKQKCKCGSSELIAETDIFDTWATSSLTPQIYINKFYGTGLSNKNIPMGLRANATDNITAWDYFTIIKSLLHFDSIPWGTVMISGFITDSTGKKLGKSLGNSIFEPTELIKEYGADMIRYWSATGGMGIDKIMALDEFAGARKLITKIWNASKFALMFLKDYTPKVTELYNFDKWIIGEYQKQFAFFLKKMEICELGHVLKELESFFWNFCDNYIEIAKMRLYKPEIYGDKAKESAQYTLYQILLGMLKQFAIYFPHITEEIYAEYFNEFEKLNSIYLAEYTCPDNPISEEELENGRLGIEIIAEIRKYKSTNQLSMKYEIEKMEICGYKDLPKCIIQDIKASCNIKDIIIKRANKKGIKI